MIAWDRVAQLREEIGEHDFQEIVTLFLDEVDEVVARLADRPDPDTLAADLHFLKGSALNLGFRSFAALCQQGEHARPGTGTVTPERVVDSYQASRRAFLAGLEPPERQCVG